MLITSKSILGASLLMLGAGPVKAQVAADFDATRPSPDAVVAGELVTEPATLQNLGFEWFVQGDTNRNASVAVEYRRQGESGWRDAMPLLHLHGERIYAESRVDIIAPNLFAGSVLDLEPDTAYEVIFDGNGNYALFDIHAADHTYNAAPEIFSVATYTGIPA